jgi:hypothetical protein
MKKRLLLFIFVVSFAKTLVAADVAALKTLYLEQYNRLYQHGMCGRNIEHFIALAEQEGIDLTGAHVLKIVGAGFLETSGFYTRQNKNKREMLGYFHVVMVANDTVFDFDLADRLTPSLANYVRLQFTPPQEPYVIFGVFYISAQELPWWTVTRYEWKDYISRSDAQVSWKKKLNQVVDLPLVLSRPRKPE